MAPTGEEVNEKFIAKVNARSGGGILGLARNFRIIDKDNSGQLSKQEFGVAMKKFNMGLTKEETEILFDFYDTDKSDSLAFDEFLKGLRSKMSEQRRELTEQAFAHMDADGSGELEVSDLKDKYDTSHHAKILDGSMTHEEVLAEFIKAFEGENGDGNSVITPEEWMDYHAGLSSNIDEDDAFGMMMAHNWGIAFIPQKVVDDILKSIKVKCEQKGGKNPKKVATDTFKFFDTDNSGAIDEKEFLKAMANFGATFGDKEMTTLFGMFDHDNSGSIEYKEMVDMIFEGRR